MHLSFSRSRGAWLLPCHHWVSPKSPSVCSSLWLERIGLVVGCTSTSPLPPSISITTGFAQVESHADPCFKLLSGIEQDLRPCVVLRQSGDVIHEGNIIELLSL
jgi:hypothetical protein